MVKRITRTSNPDVVTLAQIRGFIIQEVAKTQAHRHAPLCGQPGCRQLIREEAVTALATLEKLKPLRGNIEMLNRAIGEDPLLRPLVIEALGGPPCR